MHVSAASREEADRTALTQQLVHARQNARDWNRKAFEATKPVESQRCRGLAAAWKSTAAAKEAQLRAAGYPIPPYWVR